MGSIMCLGVSVSNSVMLVTFIDEHWKAGNAVGRGGHHRRERAAAADPDDGLRDDRGHGADGAGARAGEPDAGPARPRGDRRAGDVDVRHLAVRAVDLRGRDRQEGGRARRRSTRTTPTAGITARTPSPTTATSDAHGPNNRRRGRRRRTAAANRGHRLRLEVPDAPRFFAHDFGSRRPAAGCWLWLVAALAAPGCRHEAEIEFTSDTEAPDRAADPAAGPEHRPGRRAAQLHREL